MTSSVAKAAVLGKEYLVSWLHWLRKRNVFDDLKVLCLFIGYPRSGHSLMGSLINAHRNAVISHELDLLRYVEWRFTRGQLLALILEKDAAFGELNRKWTGYSYAVPGQFQGRFEELLVIGDKKGGATTARLRRNPRLIDRLRSTFELPVRFIHVVRNPYDNIATISNRTDRGLDYAIERYCRDLAANSELIARVGSETVLTIRHESLIADPIDTIASVCSFLTLKPSPEYLEAGASIIHETPKRTRSQVSWTEHQLETVRDCIEKYDFIRDYGF